MKVDDDDDDDDDPACQHWWSNKSKCGVDEKKKWQKTSISKGCKGQVIGEAPIYR